MRSGIKDILEGKRILLLGFGKEGRSSYELIRSLFPQSMIGIADQNEQLKKDTEQWMADPNVNYHLGEAYLSGCREYDMVIKSPGIPFDPLLAFCEREKLSSQTDLFLRAAWDRVIGVTGTKGKSTTTTLIYHLLKRGGHDVVLSGNIGIPPFSLVDAIGTDTRIVFEMSSHQLEHITVSPKTAVLLNVFPEHLDHYSDFTAYKMAKFNIHHMQPGGSLLIYNADDPVIAELAGNRKQGVRYQSYSAHAAKAAGAVLHDSHIVIHNEGRTEVTIPLDGLENLPGRHNHSNLMAAVLACLDQGMQPAHILAALPSYQRPEHRLEFVGEFSGIRYYNDSIATIPEAAIEALNTLRRVDMLILGGFDRSLDYSKLYDRLRIAPVAHLVFMGEAGERMFKESAANLSGISVCHHADSMEAVFRHVRACLSKGDVCLLSPAAASYGMFRNFEERGNEFKKMAAATGDCH